MITFVADDYGLAEPIDRAIQTLTQRGVITRVSMMANSAYTPDPLPDHIATGLHIDLTTRRSPLRLLLASYLTRGFRNHITDQITAQSNLLSQRGIPISHLDTHQHVHILPSVFNALIATAQTHDIKRIRCLTMSFKHFIPYIIALLKFGFLRQIPKIIALYTFGCFMKRKLDRANITYCPNLVLMPLAKHGDYPGLLNTLIQQFQHTDAECVTHPGGLPVPETEPYTTGREIEFQALKTLRNP